VRRRELLIGSIATTAFMGKAAAQVDGLFVLHNVRASAIMRVPIGRVDVAAWVFSLTSEDYVRCAPGEHQGAMQAKGADGKPVFISVETIGGNFMTHHYVAKRTTPDSMLAVSPHSQIWSADGILRVMQVSWALSVAPSDDGSCRLTCGILVETPDADLATRWAGRPAGTPNPVEAHCMVETPLYAADLERKARAGRYRAPD
jgi:hypothetical protein